MQTITVLLADDHRVVREGLRAILTSDRHIHIVGEAADGLQAVELARRLQPDIAIIDIAMPGMDGLRAAHEITSRAAKLTRVLMLSTYCSDDYVQRAVEAGAMGYLTKHAAGDDLLTAIHEIDNGNAFFSASAAKRLVDYCRENFIALGHTPDEKQVPLEVPVAEEEREEEFELTVV